MTENNNQEIVIVPNNKDIAQVDKNSINSILIDSLKNVRDDLKDDPYIEEAIRVLPVQGYRSSIGAIWNSVVHDLRSKILHRSIDVFNKEIKPRKEVKTYEDFQDNINDDQLIEGAYKLGIIDWEGNKLLRHAKETRHIFSGHPKSSNPTPARVLGVLETCFTYVLNVPYPPKIIDIDNYIEELGSEHFDKNKVAIENALGDLPELYNTTLINKLFSEYIDINSSQVYKSNIEFILPIFWQFLNIDLKKQVIRRVDNKITNGNKSITNNALSFVELVNGIQYLSHTVLSYKIEPLVENLINAYGNWDEENKIVAELEKYSGYIPQIYQSDYVTGLTQTYIGKQGYSNRFSRTNFYANGAALIIPDMFKKFDENLATLFLIATNENKNLLALLDIPSKMERFSQLAEIVNNEMSSTYKYKHIYELIINTDTEEKNKPFLDLLKTIG